MKKSPQNSPRDGDGLSPDRLFESSNAVMKALAEMAELTGESTCYPPDLLGTPMQPRCLCDFTRHEVKEATDFLVRMGFLEPVKNRERPV